MVVKHCEQDQCLSKSNLEGLNNLPQYCLPSTVPLFLPPFILVCFLSPPSPPLSISNNTQFEFFLSNALDRGTMTAYFLNWSPSGALVLTINKKRLDIRHWTDIHRFCFHAASHKHIELKMSNTTSSPATTKWGGKVLKTDSVLICFERSPCRFEPLISSH